jgi:NitT/TauT family transport system permease protein
MTINATHGPSISTDGGPTTRLTELQALEIARKRYGHGAIWNAVRSDWVLYPLSLMLALGAWYALIWIFSIPEYLLPTPGSVAVAARENAPVLLQESWTTLTEILLAFLACVVVGIPTGIIIASSQVVEKLINPLLVLSQGIPKIALAPVFLAWFGFGLQANLAIAFLIAVFPIVVNTVLGMHSLDPAVVRLGKSTGASKLRLFTVVRLPTALPNILAGMKISVTFAAIGAIIGEFAAGTAGLGYLIQVTVGNLSMPLGFAAIAMTALVGLATYIGVELLERILLRSHPKMHRN